MKIVDYISKPSPSFLSLERDAQIIMQDMLKNNNLKKLLYRTDKHCLAKTCPDLSDEETLKLIDEGYISLIPKIEINDMRQNYIILTFGSFSPLVNTRKFRGNTITFNIICHLNNWNLGDFQLRPYKIAGEIDGMFDGKNVSGGELSFLACEQLILNDELAGLVLTYRIVHGEEDKR